MKPFPFQRNKISVAIGAALPRIFREPVKPTPQEPATMDAQNP